MKTVFAILTVILGINLIFVLPAETRFAGQQLRQVPISRLLRNLELQRKDAIGSTDKALVDFRIGRLHAMAYARKTEEAPCDSAAIPNSRFELPDFGHQPDHVQFKVAYAKDQAKNRLAKAHLDKAIKSMEAALKTDPSMLMAKLGLAWCLEQAGKKDKSVNLYRQVVNQAYEDEKNAKGGMYNWSITVEASSYLRALLDPKKDKKELDLLSKKTAEIEKLPRYITPIAIPLGESTELIDMIENKSVIFDLDGSGPKEYSKWLSRQAAWLVYDSDNTGTIDSGLKLIGQSSFWIFWRNGYEVLNGLDDNRDGFLKGSELDSLALWQDANGNAISDTGEVHSLAEFGIISLAVSFDNHKDGILWSQTGVRFKDGRTVPSYDLILPSKTTVDLR